MTRVWIILALTLFAIAHFTTAFSPSPVVAVSRQSLTTTFAIGNKKKKEKEDLSYIETRDMTRAEMEELNKKNEDIMNMELSMMTGFSLVLSLPILYLCWVAFFSD